MISRQTTLYLRVSEAKNLLAKDFNGKSDPYCVIKVDNVIIARTATVYKTLDPLWAEEFILHMASGFQTLSLYIYDADKVSGDDIIGMVSITKEMMNDQRNPRGLENWFPLQKANKDLEIQGEILLEYGIRTSEATGQSHLFVTVVEGRDLAPKDKTGYSDPYVTVTCFDETKTTSNQKKTRFPEWHETLEFLLPTDSTYNRLSVIVTVWDKDRLSSDDFMGQVHLGTYDVTHGTVKKWHAVARRPHFDALSVRRGSRVERGKVRCLWAWYVKVRCLCAGYVKVRCLCAGYVCVATVGWSGAKCNVYGRGMSVLRQSGGAGQSAMFMGGVCQSAMFMGGVCLCCDSRVERGKVRLKLQLVEETVLPSSCYEPIETLFLQMLNEHKMPGVGTVTWDLLEQERTMELGHMAGALVRFYLAKETIIEYLDKLIQRDLDRTDDPNTVFRGNTLGTKSVDQFMKILGTPYLQETLQPVIERIFTERKTVELDPSRVNSVRRRHSLHWESEESFIHTSMEALESYMVDVIDGITKSVPACPLALRIVLRNIYLRAKVKWPHESHEETPYLAVSGFIFLRFFAPAILSPKLFSLFDMHPNRKIHRTLTIMAKVTQSLGNLVVPQGCKEAWMEPLVPFMTSKLSCVRGFLEDLITINVEDVSPRSLVRQQSNDTVLMQGRLYLCHYHCHRLFRPIVLKKCYFCLTRAMLSYSKTPDDSNEQTMVMVENICAVEPLDYGALGKTNMAQIIIYLFIYSFVYLSIDLCQEQTMVMVENICAVEPLDYGALGKSNMAQIIHKTPDDGTGIIYFQAKNVNDLQGWMSAIRKTCKYNSCRVDTFHPGVFRGDKWNCCHRDQDWAPGCSQTYNGVVLGDWQDPLDPVLDAQIIFSQLHHTHDTLRKRQHDLRVQLARSEDGSREGPGGETSAPSQQLNVLSRILDGIDQLAMSHEAFRNV
ncbi:hypothetical protein ACOMHN_001421 [Nucella lapillus]